MTMTFRSGAAPAAIGPAERLTGLFEVEESYWGYTVRGTGLAPPTVRITQTLAWAVGFAALVAAASIWFAPQVLPMDDPFLGRLGTSGLLVAFAALLLWFAGRGATAETQVDLSLAEVREVVRSTGGKPRLVVRYGFDEIGGVFLDRGHVPAGQARLVLRYRNTAQTLAVAVGPVDALTGLRDRLGRDLKVRYTVPQTEEP